MNKLRYTRKSLNEHLDFTGLEKELKRRLGFAVKLEGKVTQSNRANWCRIEFASKNVIKHTGIMSNVMREVTIDSFSSIIEKDYTGWVGVHFSWTSNRGGTNGLPWFYAYYDFNTKEWTFVER